MSNAFIYRMTGGVAGDISRKEFSKAEPNVIDTNYPPLRYGEPIKMVSGKARPFTTGDDSVAVYGFGVRPYPFQAAVSEALAAGTQIGRAHV